MQSGRIVPQRLHCRTDITVSGCRFPDHGDCGMNHTGTGGWPPAVLLAVLVSAAVLFGGCGGRQTVTYTLQGGSALTEAVPETNPSAEASSGAERFSAPAEDSGSEGETAEQPEICVYVCGAVRKPGVYMLPDGSRVYAALEAAGGLLEEADPRQINQAELLSDGQQITIYTAEELDAMPETSASRDADGRVNINTAGMEELMTLPGIGQVRAEAIIRWRTEHGAFGTIEDIKQVEGIKEASFRKISDRICI